MITPARLLLLVVAIGAAAVGGYGLAIAKSLPMSVSGAVVFAVAVFVLGLLAVRATIRAGRRGEGRTAFMAAFFGGLCMLAASGALTGAIVLGLLASPT